MTKVLLIALVMVCQSIALLHSSTSHADEPVDPPGDQTGDQTEVVDNGNFSRAPIGDIGNADSVQVPGLQLGAPAYGGSACPAGSVSSALSPDQKTLTVLFDAYTARAGGSAAPRARTGCSLQIPFQVPAGYRVQIVTMDYRGFASVPAGAGASFNANFGYVGMRNNFRRRMRFNRGAQLVGPMQDNFTLSSRISGPPWSPCGAAFTLQADSSLTVGTNRELQEVVATIDSLDATALPLRFNLRWQQCDGDEARPPRGEGAGPGRPGWGRPERPERPEPPGRPDRPHPPRGRFTSFGR